MPCIYLIIIPNSIFRYRPLKRGEDREKLKDKLANAMAYEVNEDLNIPTPPVRLPKPEPKLPTKKDIWHDRMLYLFKTSVIFRFTVTLVGIEFQYIFDVKSIPRF